MSVDGIISQIERKRISSRREFDLMIATESTEIVNFDMFFFSCYVFQQQPRKNKNIHIEICRHSIKLLIFFLFLGIFFTAHSQIIMIIEIAQIFWIFVFFLLIIFMLSEN